MNVRAACRPPHLRSSRVTAPARARAYRRCTLHRSRLLAGADSPTVSAPRSSQQAALPSPSSTRTRMRAGAPPAAARPASAACRSAPSRTSPTPPSSPRASSARSRCVLLKPAPLSLLLPLPPRVLSTAQSDKPPDVPPLTSPYPRSKRPPGVEVSPSSAARCSRPAAQAPSPRR